MDVDILFYFLFFKADYLTIVLMVASIGVDINVSVDLRYVLS